MQIRRTCDCVTLNFSIFSLSVARFIFQLSPGSLHAIFHCFTIFQSDVFKYSACDGSKSCATPTGEEKKMKNPFVNFISTTQSPWSNRKVFAFTWITSLGISIFHHQWPFFLVTRPPAIFLLRQPKRRRVMCGTSDNFFVWIYNSL